jgi:hypothetical protein
MLENLKDYVDLLQPLAAIVIAMVSVFIALQQHDLKVRTFNKDLYDKRYPVYESIITAVESLKYKYEFDSAKLDKELATTSFFFENETVVFVAGIRKELIDLRQVMLEYIKENNYESSEEKSEENDAIAAAVAQAVKQLENLAIIERFEEDFERLNNKIASHYVDKLKI